MRLKDADKLIELIDDDIASLDKDMSRQGYDVCLCTLKMAKQYIKALPTVEAVPLEDYRSMERTVDKLVKALAEAVQKHGRWVHKYGDGHEEPAIPGGECSICGYVHTATNYCPNCGARMDEEVNNDV